MPRGPQISRARRRLAVLLAVPLLVLLSMIALRVAYTGRALPGTQLGGTGVEGDSRGALRERMTRFTARPVTIFAAGKTLRVTPSGAGYDLDVEATVDRVLDEGRGGPLMGLVSASKGLFTTRDVQPVARVDDAKLEQTGRDFARMINRDAYPGGVSVDPASLQVDVQPPRQGRTADRPTLERDLVAALRSGRTRLEAPFASRKVATVAAVEKVGREAERYLQRPLTLTGAGSAVVVEPEGLAPILRLRASRKDRTQVRLGIDEDALKKLVASVAARRDRSDRSARLSAPSKLTVFDDKGKASFRPRKADVRVTREARTGRKIDREKALADLADAIRTGTHKVKLPVATVTPAVSAKAAEAVDMLIGTFTTRYQPGQPRVTNIRRMARTVDGTVIAAGGQFSLNGVVGKRTKAGGYLEAPYIANGKLVPSVGGGVSQFSTTMYNAAYFAGLKLDSHQPHSFYIGRYPPGREATLDFPGIDLTWTNDTDAPVLVRTASDATSVTVSLYGDNGGRRVTSTPGPRKAVSGRDFQIRVVRTITVPGGDTRDDSFTTTYDKPPE